MIKADEMMEALRRRLVCTHGIECPDVLCREDQSLWDELSRRIYDAERERNDLRVMVGSLRKEVDETNAAYSTCFAEREKAETALDRMKSAGELTAKQAFENACNVYHDRLLRARRDVAAMRAALKKAYRRFAEISVATKDGYITKDCCTVGMRQIEEVLGEDVQGDSNESAE